MSAMAASGAVMAKPPEALASRESGSRAASQPPEQEHQVLPMVLAQLEQRRQRAPLASPPERGSGRLRERPEPPPSRGRLHGSQAVAPLKRNHARKRAQGLDASPRLTSRGPIEAPPEWSFRSRGAGAIWGCACGPCALPRSRRVQSKQGPPSCPSKPSTAISAELQCYLRPGR